MACVRVLNRALFLFFHDHVAAVIQLSFMPKGAVRQVMFARGGAHRHFLGKGFVMGYSLTSSELPSEDQSPFFRPKDRQIRPYLPSQSADADAWPASPK